MDNNINNILAQINRYVLGKEKQVKLALACMLAKGHLLLEDLPGMGKTTLAHTLADTLGLSYQRVQFTSDMLPADITGINVFDNQKQAFSLHKGPIFNQLILADEINRASPKTQSALLESMEEGQVSIDGKTYTLPDPFFVIATQNPQHHLGTYPLPESQMDRFTMRLSLGFPTKDAEKMILNGQNKRVQHQALPPQIDAEQLLSLQALVREVTVSDSLLDYVIALGSATREQSKFNALSPRALQALVASSKAWAFIHGRDYALPEDVQAVFVPVCQHRMDSQSLGEHEQSYALQVLKSVDPSAS
ncbi:AAA family ATPase [Thalassotalea agarivorans]|uniref:MoxR-like ATPase n=1 Tax=Thalassotalea agarivorans TaxID=349064 RepID=A0A1I0EVG6_THASX|nr:MoxR family ATPase [Thalassotalea agarivorans]SET49582.1 MoxR-like ATPase [Thalassotalea agarivorans]